ncbi:MAG: hypothetical protein QMD85_00525 [Candidatus Aenigmarchaeota archaeon]|nr:hypothetical protein [Candidatus Aenigmarchaeota archaeon]MDI6722004.1 hypothetical protein [Candidatus Aenigmarchaeota archaeon]
MNKTAEYFLIGTGILTFSIGGTALVRKYEKPIERFFYEKIMRDTHIEGYEGQPFRSYQIGGSKKSIRAVADSLSKVAPEKFRNHPEYIVDQIMKRSRLTDKDAKYLRPGHTIMIPDYRRFSLKKTKRMGRK